MHVEGGGRGDLCRKHADNLGKDGWLGKVTGEIPEKKLKQFEKAREKARASVLATTDNAGEARGGPRDGVGASSGIAMVLGESAQGEGVAGTAASGGRSFQRLRRAGFVVDNAGEGLERATGEAVGGGRSRGAPPRAPPALAPLRMGVGVAAW